MVTTEGTAPGKGRIKRKTINRKGSIMAWIDVRLEEVHRSARSRVMATICTRTMAIN